MGIFYHTIMKNIIGLKIGRLTILERVGKNKHKQQLLLCLCECGCRTTVTYSNLFRADNKRTSSCGCYSREQHISKQTWEVEFRRFAKSSAGRRNLEFTLTLEEFKSFCENNCHYCGASPAIKTHVGMSYRNSIDRLDSTIGYTLPNCVSCCTICQFMKNSLNYVDFINQIKKISKNFS